MLEILKRNPLAAVIAVVMHIAIIAFLIVGVDWLEKPVQPRPNVDVVQARVIDQARIDAEVARLKAAEEKKKAALRKEEKRLADLKRKQQKEKKRLAELEKKRKAREKAEAAKRAKAKKKAEAEKRRKAAARKKAEEKKRKAAAARKKAEAEKKRKAAEARKKAEAEKRRKAAEAKRKAAEAARLAAEQKAREEALQAQLEAERAARERDRYGRAIKLKIEDNWLRPSTVGEGLSCEVRVRLLPGGGVAAVTITRSSGNGAFDRSVEQAVYKAEPLPVPAGAGFEAFRELKFVFDPSK
ncbi:MAG TPA: cell envelope integrity protein TolA [Sedimenticola sp.]|nr:cell envelope integrity protein TolA [Sedimenticola sp.]